MLKALFKKQLTEVNTWLLQNKKSGKRRSGAGIAGLILVYAFLFALLGFVFYFVGSTLCEPLAAMGLGWLYFAMMGLLAVLFGVFGSVFNTYATLYQAKDNALLLSLPIPPSAILTVRLFGVWMWGLIYEAIVFIPALLVYWQWDGFRTGTVLAGLFLLLVLSFFVLTLSCLLGWVVAKISARLKHKSFIVVLASLAFFALYYYVYFRAYEMLQLVLVNAQSLGQRIQGAAYPVYLLGRAGEGDGLSVLLFTLLIGVLFALTWLVLSKSFLKIATTNSGAAKKRYKETAVKIRSTGGALLARERLRFFSSATYMLNCGLGTLMLLIAAAALLIKGPWLREILGQLGLSASLPLLACAALCTLSTMNDITAPSVSLEGKSLWLIQSLPVSAWQALQAKLKLHLLFTEIPTLLCSLSLIAALRPGVFSSLMLVTLPMVFVLFSAAFGLAVNLKSPDLKWTNETVPVKQSLGVMLSLFGGWVLVILLGLLYFALRQLISPDFYLLLCTLLMGAVSALLLAWLKTRGARIFETL